MQQPGVSAHLMHLQGYLQYENPKPGKAGASLPISLTAGEPAGFLNCL